MRALFLYLLLWEAACHYTADMKVAVAIPDVVYQEAERLALRMKKSRNQLYEEAIAEYIARHDPDAITEAMNKVCVEVDSRPDPPVSAVARRILKQSEWE
jgi:hypothetical protein